MTMMTIITYCYYKPFLLITTIIIIIVNIIIVVNIIVLVTVLVVVVLVNNLGNVPATNHMTHLQDESQTLSI